MTTPATITATDASFDALIATPDDIPVLVDFWADWCGPCKALAPALDEIARDYAGELVVAKLDIVANEAVSARQGVQNIPLLVVYRHGQEVARSVGALTKSRLAAFVDQHLA